MSILDSDGFPQTALDKQLIVTLSLRNPCTTATFYPQSFSSISKPVLSHSYSITYPVFTLNTQTQNPVNCGPITYSLDPPSYNFVTLNQTSRLMIVSTTNLD